MKYCFLFLLLFLSSFHLISWETYAACDESRASSSTSDSFDTSTNCYTDASTNKTYSVQASSLSTPSLTESPNLQSNQNILWLSDDEIRRWEVDLDTIPQVIVNIINYLLWIAGTVSIVALIYHAVQMQLHSGITGDSSWVDKAKAGMKWAILGFILAVLAWFIVARVIDVLSTLSS